MRQNWIRTANSACREGALMFGSSVVLWPNSGRPAVSLPAVTLVLGALKFARLKMLNSCAMNSARYGRDAEGLRQPQVDVGEARAIDGRDFGEAAAACGTCSQRRDSCRGSRCPA